MWLGWVCSIFDGFTFTEWYDFLPLGCLLMGLGSAGCSGFSPKPASLRLKTVLAMLSLWPLFPAVTLFVLALQVVKHEGTWPRVMVDDPKNLIGLSATYDFWFHATAYTEAFAGAAMASFGALLAMN